MNYGTYLQIVTCLYALCDVNHAHDATSTCIEPDIEKLHRDIPHLYEDSLDPTFLNLPRLQPIVKRKNGYIYPFGSRFQIFYGGYRTCLEARKKVRKEGGNLCPSYFILEYDSDRIPRELIQAECSCETCSLKRRSQAIERSTHNVYLGCEKMYTYTHVLRRAGCIGGVWSYRLFWEKVSVGCSCNVMFKRTKDRS